MGDLPQITISLEAKEKNLLYFLCQFIDANPSQNPILFIKQVNFLIHYLPKSMKEALDQIKKGIMHVLVFENIPMEQVPHIQKVDMGCHHLVFWLILQKQN